MASKTFFNILNKALFSTILIIINAGISVGLAQEETNPYRHSLALDNNGKYLLEWEVDWDVNRTVFSVIAKTRGYVGFGLSRKGLMAGADIVIGGVSPDGKAYFSDFYATGHSPPVKDPSQDWTLHSASENASHTFLSFSRVFDTCDDEHDYLIDDNSLAMIWAYGETDNVLEYHHENKGSKPIYLLDPEVVPRSIVPFQRTPEEAVTDKNVQIWEILETEVMPARPTTYICSIYKFTSANKRHIIGYNPILPTELEQRHFHHYILFRCNLPPDQNPEEVFDPVLGIKDECYILQEPIGRVPTNLCQEQLYVWAVGDEANFLPDHVGIPTSETGADYYMLQRHFNNPDLLPGVSLTYGLEIFTTETLREHDSGIVFVAKLFPASPGIMIPPSSLGHVIHGHCGSECTRLRIPPEGIRIYSAQLHTHTAGQSVAVVHIRNGKELPRITGDDNYFPTYQKSRVFREEKLVLPGDQIFMRCVYENTGRNNSVTIGGFDALNEMCVGSLSYYNKIPNWGTCGSELRSQEYREFLRIYNTTWSNEILENVITSPPDNAGLPVSEVGNQINWTLKKRQELQYLHRHLPQITVCPQFVQEPLEPTEKGWVSHPSDLISIQKQFVQKELPISSKHFKRSVAGGRNSSGFDYEREILFPEFEFVSIYEKNVVPWKDSRICPNNKVKSGRY